MRTMEALVIAQGVDMVHPKVRVQFSVKTSSEELVNNLVIILDFSMVKIVY